MAGECARGLADVQTSRIPILFPGRLKERSEMAADLDHISVGWQVGFALPGLFAEGVEVSGIKVRQKVVIVNVSCVSRLLGLSPHGQSASLAGEQATRTTVHEAGQIHQLGGVRLVVQTPFYELGAERDFVLDVALGAVLDEIARTAIRTRRGNHVHT